MRKGSAGTSDTPRKAATSRDISEWQSRSEDSVRWRESSQHSFSAASQAYRRGGSDHLLRQAAGFLADRGLEEVRRARRIEGEKFDAIVDAQSDADTVDLHGVPVYDGVRIALEKAEAWWDRLGEGKVAKARSQPLAIVTGIGRHSATGVSKMRQDVGAALRREGWQFEQQTGRFVIMGRQD